MAVYFLSAERTGSLWDCGEFVLGAYKLQVVHPPGAPLFLLVGRMFAWVASIFSSDPATIAFAVNLMSGLFTAFGAMLIAQSTSMFSKLAWLGRGNDTTDSNQNIILGVAGMAAGLSMAFSTSIWFSAVEGEVYGMSTFFTTLTIWAAVKWYYLPDSKQTDKWLVFAAYAVGLSIGVHLLSLLAIPFLAILYYIKKYEKHTMIGYGMSVVIGMILVWFYQKVVIVGIPALWKAFEIPMVNSFGMPFHSGLIPVAIILAALFYFGFKYAVKKKNDLAELLIMSALMVVIGFSTIGIVVIRANADTPVNMNTPTDVTRLLPYINREQYGERPILKGPHFDSNVSGYSKEKRYGRVGDKYAVVDEKLSYEYRAKDEMLFPRVQDKAQGRETLHKRYWYPHLMGKEYGNKKRPGMLYNIKFFVQYQMGWMYWRYFLWNFVGRQNFSQGYFPWNHADGNWESGVTFIDEARLYNMDALPDAIKNNESRNHYFFLPLLFGLFGLLFHFMKTKKDFGALLFLFIITGIGIVVFVNEPPNEPRERDYVFVGSFLTYAIWIGMGAVAMFTVFKDKFKLNSTVATVIASGLVLLAPLLMGFQNFDDHSRHDHTGARDYASNFLTPLDENSIIFTYGDNDTYPLWYAQEVEGIRTDVRVVNLSLIAVDWYIEKLRHKQNNSEAINMSIPTEAYRGKKRNQVFINPRTKGNPMNVFRVLKEIANPKNVVNGQTIMSTNKLIIPVDKQKMLEKGIITGATNDSLIQGIPINLGKKTYITKDQLAVIDLIASNINDRSIYFATTCQNEKLLGLNDFTQLEGLGLKLVPVRTPSDKSFGIYGSGRVNLERTYDSVMNRWKWGNFDKEDTFVTGSYAAGAQSLKMTIIRTAMEFLKEGKNTEADNLAKKYFEAFPNYNFSYDAQIIPAINILIQVKDYKEAKKQLRILANEVKQHMDFYATLDKEELESFKQEASMMFRAMSDVINNSKLVDDPEFAAKINNLMGDYANMKLNNLLN